MTDDTSPFPADYAPRMHRAEVLQTRRLGPGMIRVRFGGEDLRDYPTTGIGDEYVRMFFPDAPDDDLRMPRITSLRGWEYPDGVAPSEMRVYTIRDHAPGEVVVDFVDHDGGIAAAWAQQARPGQAVGINPPCGLYERPEGARRQILVADEPGLPAALRIAELTAAGVPTTLLLEVRGTGFRMPETTDAEYVWLDGAGNGHGASRVLDELRRRTPGDDTYVWVSTEGKVNRAARRYLRHDQRLPSTSYKCVAYWQERAEDWRARYDAMGEGFAAKLQDIRLAKGRDTEEVVDAIEELYESAGL